jgi:hypothetical protein
MNMFIVRCQQLSPTFPAELAENYKKIHSFSVSLFFYCSPSLIKINKQPTRAAQSERMGNQAFRGTNYLFLTAEKGELKGEMELTRHGNFHIGSYAWALLCPGPGTVADQ